MKVIPRTRTWLIFGVGPAPGARGTLLKGGGLRPRYRGAGQTTTIGHFWVRGGFVLNELLSELRGEGAPGRRRRKVPTPVGAPSGPGEGRVFRSSGG